MTRRSSREEFERVRRRGYAILWLVGGVFVFCWTYPILRFAFGA